MLNDVHCSVLLVVKKIKINYMPIRKGMIKV